MRAAETALVRIRDITLAKSRRSIADDPGLLRKPAPDPQWAVVAQYAQWALEALEEER